MGVLILRIRPLGLTSSSLDHSSSQDQSVLCSSSNCSTCCRLIPHVPSPWFQAPILCAPQLLEKHGNTITVWTIAIIGGQECSQYRPSLQARGRRVFDWGCHHACRVSPTQSELDEARHQAAPDKSRRCFSTVQCRFLFICYLNRQKCYSLLNQDHFVNFHWVYS